LVVGIVRSKGAEAPSSKVSLPWDKLSPWFGMTLREERLAFDEVPEIYDRVRPSYPDAAFNDLFSYLRERLDVAEPSVLEIGPGTGKATRSLLERGTRVTAVEIGPRLAAFLERKLSREFPGRLRVVNSSFEDAAVEPEAFDIVTAATAFHWIDPAVRWRKSHDALRPGGVIAIIGTNQIRSAADHGFFERVLLIYQKYRPDEQPGTTPDENVVPAEYEEVRASGLFAGIELRRYRWDQTYPTSAYADLVRSYAGTQMMAEAGREGLIADLCRVIDEEYGGSVTRPLVITLTLGRRA
jgi:SAM-dependent methyltransferase